MGYLILAIEAHRRVVHEHHADRVHGLDDGGEILGLGFWPDRESVNVEVLLHLGHETLADFGEVDGSRHGDEKIRSARPHGRVEDGLGLHAVALVDTRRRAIRETQEQGRQRGQSPGHDLAASHGTLHASMPNRRLVGASSF